MKEAIGIYSESSRNIIYEEKLSLYKIIRIDKDNLDEIDKVKLLIVDFDEYKAIHNWIKDVKGIGRIELNINPHLLVKRTH